MIVASSGPERFPVGVIRTSTVLWHDQPGDKPGRGELVLAQSVQGDSYLMFWRDDAQLWDDPCNGFVPVEVVAWARLPVYEP